MEDRLTEPGDVMLLYLPLAHNYGRLLHLSAAYIGFTIAFLPDPLRAGTELPRVRPHLFPSVPRVYEKIHTAVVAKFDEETGAQAQADRLGARRRLSRVEAAPGEAARAARSARAAQARRPARLQEGEGAARRAPARRERRRRSALARHRRVLPRARHPHPRGLRALGGDDGRDGQPRERLQVRHGRQAAAGRRGSHRRGRRDPAALEHGVRRLLPRRERDGRGARRAKASCTRATSATSTRTGSS